MAVAVRPSAAGRAESEVRGSVERARDTGQPQREDIGWSSEDCTDPQPGSYVIVRGIIRYVAGITERPDSIRFVTGTDYGHGENSGSLSAARDPAR